MKKLSDKGFTLVELLVVIAIVVLIPAAIFGVPWLLMKAWNYVLPDMFG